MGTVWVVRSAVQCSVVERSAVWSALLCRVCAYSGVPGGLLALALCPPVFVMRGCVPLPAGDGLGVFVPRSRVCG